MLTRPILALAATIWMGAAFAQNPSPSNITNSTIPSVQDQQNQVVSTWPVPEPVDFVCPFKSDIDYEPGEISCGLIAVPENREDANSRMIRLHYVKIAATGEDEEYRKDPVIYLTGGPGVGVDLYVDRLREHSLVKQRDLYILEQRGIGASANFCPYFGLEERALAHSNGLEEAQRNAAEVTRNCFDAAREAGVDLSGYNTVENARDVKALRQALGFEQWNVWGISYGSHLGQMLALQDPQGIRALVIDAIVPNDLTDLMRIGRWANLVLEHTFSTCTDLAICEDLEARLDTALDKVRGNPFKVPVDDTELFPQGEVEVNGLILAFAPFSMAYEQDEHPAIPSVMNTLIEYFETENEDFLQLAANILNGSQGISVSEGMSNAIRCNDGYVHATAEVAADDLEENPRFAGLSSVEGAQYAARMCEESGLAPRDREDYRFVESAIPTLIVNGSWDPVTPAALARYIAPGFSNGRYIEVPFAGHGPTRSMEECAGPVLNTFFDDLDPVGLDASCLEEGVGKPEYLHLMSTLAPVKLGSLAQDAPKSFMLPGLWFGLPLFVLVLGLFLMTASFLTRVFEKTSVDKVSMDLTSLRRLSVLTALSGIGFVALTAYGLYAASEVSSLALIAGLHPVAWLAPWLSLISGLLGLLLMVSLVRRRIAGAYIQRRSLIGLFLIGSAALILSLFALSYDLSIF
jgi:pimeloyl-ACP methyl ester carboxylesterase